MTKAADRTSPRAERTRTALLGAGLELLSQRPIDAIAIDEVVARAGVGKGSFFNHFADKHAFARAIGAAVRAELEERITSANRDQSDPVLRIATGMRVGVDYALAEPVRAAVMLRSLEGSTMRHNELNQGLRSDIALAAQAGLLRPEAEASGLLFWLGLCQVVMLNVLERQAGRREASERLREMAVLGLTGLGIAPDRAAQAAAEVERLLLDPDPR